VLRSGSNQSLSMLFHVRAWIPRKARLHPTKSSYSKHKYISVIFSQHRVDFFGAQFSLPLLVHENSAVLKEFQNN